MPCENGKEATKISSRELTTDGTITPLIFCIFLYKFYHVFYQLFVLVSSPFVPFKLSLKENSIITARMWTRQLHAYIFLSWYTLLNYWRLYLTDVELPFQMLLSSFFSWLSNWNVIQHVLIRKLISYFIAHHELYCSIQDMNRCISIQRTNYISQTSGITDMQEKFHQAKKKV